MERKLGLCLLIVPMSMLTWHYTHGQSQCQFECLSVSHVERLICLPTTSMCNGVVECYNKSDEVNCPPMRNCSSAEYSCQSGQCIDINWVCDGDNDCIDSSDETTCPERQCAGDQFRCNDGSCISAVWRCDSDFDCQDGSDESACVVTNMTFSCPEKFFQCNDTEQCIPNSFVCDGEQDCDDFTDEADCKGKRVRCSRREFLCGGLCVSESWRCDGDVDCEDRSDEIGCHELCSNDQFRCDNDQCIHSAWLCDGDFDCSDRSDERHCSRNETEVCDRNQFHCADNRCVDRSKVCDGRFDCKDKSDELNCESLRDQCLANGRCSQRCVNSDGSYQCSCVDGYQLRSDGHSCSVLSSDFEPFLLLANRLEIRKIVPNRRHQMDQQKLLVHGLENVNSLDIHVANDLMFWIDATFDHIRAVDINAPLSSNARDIVVVGLDSPGGIACDWIHDKLFWTDSGSSRIEVVNLDGSMRKVIVWKDLEKPRAIAVHPGQGALYWTDWGSEPKIEKSAMDGSERRVIVNGSLFWPNGLTVDYAANKIYWTDARYHVIESADLEGAMRTVVVSQGLPHPFGVTVLGDDIYWTDWHTKSVNHVNKLNAGHTEIVLSQLHYPMDLRIFHPLRQPQFLNHCGADNGHCSHLCLPTQSGYNCACPTGFRLLPNGRNCAENLSNFIVFARSSDLRRISLDTEDRTDVIIPVSGLKSAVALDWDDATDYVFWSDLSSDSIHKARWDGTGQEVVVSSSVESPTGLAIDWITRKLYWTDAGEKRIEMSDIDGILRTVLVWEHLDKPRDIAVNPLSGLMYWTDWGGQPKIEQAGMDGSERRVFISYNLIWPNSLTIDHQLNRLYWSDASRKCIEYIDLDGSHRQVLTSLNLPHPFGVAVDDSRLYWTDWKSHNIESVNKFDGSDRKILRSNLADLMDIHVFHRQRPKVDSDCFKDNGGCSHLCLISPTYPKYVCACPVGVLLLADGKTCSPGMNNMLVFSQQTDLHAVSLDVSYFSKVSIKVSTDLQNVVATDVDVATGKIYWSDVDSDTIKSSCLNGTCAAENLVISGLDTVDGLAIDVIGQLLYWTDSTRNHIEVLSLTKHIRTVLVWENLDSPRAITLHYDAGYMFWTDWGREPRIERADMDGSNRFSLVTHNLGWPNGITVDIDTSRIIWVDAKTEVIETASLDGSDRQLLVTSLPHPYGITVFNGFIYWTDWVKQAIYRANSTTGNDVVTVLNRLPGVMDIHAVSTGTINSENVCGKDNGGCSDFCLRSSSGYTCRCSTGILLRPNNRSCSSDPTRYLLVATKSSVRRISLDTIDATDVIISLTDAHNVIALDLDIADDKLYYTDVYLDVIRRSQLSGANVSTLVATGTSTMDGIAVDWIAKNLYWTDRGQDLIEVSRLDGSHRMILISSNLDEPRAITVHPTIGHMFWSDWGKNPKIEKAFLDGTNRTAIVNTDIGWPNGLCIDYTEERLFWADAKLDRIETSDFNGDMRRLLVDQVHHPFGLALYGDHLYVSDWQLQGIERFDKRNGRGRTIIRSKLEGIMDIRIVAEDVQTGSNACFKDNGGCDELCMFRPAGRICMSSIPLNNKNFPHNNTTVDNEWRTSNDSREASVNRKPVMMIVIGTIVVCVILVLVVLLVALIKRRRGKHYSVRRELLMSSANRSFHQSKFDSSSIHMSVIHKIPRWRPFQSQSTEDGDATSVVNTSTFQMTPLLGSPVHLVRLDEDDDFVANDDESGVSLTESLGVSLSDSRSSINQRLQPT